MGRSFSCLHHIREWWGAFYVLQQSLVFPLNAESNFMSLYMISCAQNQPNLAIFYEDALSCTSVSNFFSFACHFWLVICYGSWAKFLLCLEQGVKYISAIWLENDVVWKWTYYMGYAEPRLKLFMRLCLVLPSAFVLWEGCSYFPSRGSHWQFSRHLQLPWVIEK